MLTLSIIIAGCAFAAFMYFNSPPSDSSRQTDEDIILANDGSYIFEVRRGESAQSVGRRLERAGLIKNRYFWNLLCRYQGEFLKVGTYRIEVPKSQLEIYRLLVSGRQILHRVTIPEGVTLTRAARILEDAGICSAADFLTAARDPFIISGYRIPNNSMEGYLFPDTYMFPANFPAVMVIRTMADNFFSKIPELHNTGSLSPEELNRIVILASIVEREYRLPEEAPVMAGVFYNRLRIGMALQSCATVEYVITEILGRPHPSVLLYADLEIRNPYNTYQVRGLPPGPISAPGIIALRAAFNPAPTDYLFFRLIDPVTGRHHFSRTLDEHNRAGQRAR